MKFSRFSEMARDAGLTARNCGNGHWRVEGGNFNVNYWPASKRRSAHVDGHNGKVTKSQVTPEQALRLAYFIPDKPVPKHKRAERKKSYKKWRKKLYKKSNKCYLCGEKFESIERATIDHVIPLSKGGSNSLGNLRLAHEHCNQEKGDELRVEKLPEYSD